MNSKDTDPEGQLITDPDLQQCTNLQCFGSEQKRNAEPTHYLGNVSLHGFEDVRSLLLGSVAQHLLHEEVRVLGLGHLQYVLLQLSKQLVPEQG